MAMLAAPRRKQKVINLRAKNNEWSNDTNKFGQRMLEKMGWSSGKGLGAKENGIVEHVVARYKNDDKGLGFEDKNDQWTKHEDDFNALLSNLSNAEGSQEKLHSGISLEVKSKKSKSRVHYHKFTRGKDLTRYSEKDLANIFGKKSLKAEEKQEEPLQANVETSEQIFTEKGSMEDYFKSKLAKLKSKSKLLQDKNENEDENVDYAFKSFSGNSDEPADEKTKQSSFSFYKSAITQDINGSFVKSQGDDKESESVTKIKKKKKNKNKLSNHCEQDSDNITSKCDSNIRNISELIVSNTEVDTQLKNKSIKQNKEAEEITMKSKKKKYKKKFDDEDNKHILDTSHALSLTNEEDYVHKKKKKRKNKDKK